MKRNVFSSSTFECQFSFSFHQSNPAKMFGCAYWKHKGIVADVTKIAILAIASGKINMAFLGGPYLLVY